MSWSRVEAEGASVLGTHEELMFQGLAEETVDWVKWWHLWSGRRDLFSSFSFFN